MNASSLDLDVDLVLAAPEPEELPETGVHDVRERDVASDDIDSVPLVEVSLDELAEAIHNAWATAKRRSMEAAEAYLTVGRALLEARSRFPGKRQFGDWCDAQAFPFNRQRAYVLRRAAENETAVRVALTSQLVNGRCPNIETALSEVLGRAGPRGCQGHPHVRHPYPSTGWLCLTDGADPDDRIAWANDLMATQYAHAAAEAARPAGDGKLKDWLGPPSLWPGLLAPLPPALTHEQRLRADLRVAEQREAQWGAHADAIRRQLRALGAPGVEP